MGHYKIQTQNVKKTNINYQQWRIQIRNAKTWRKIQICEQRGRVQQCRTKKWRRIWFFSLKWARKCAQKRKLNEVTYTEREKTRVNTWIISYTNMTCMGSRLFNECCWELANQARSHLCWEGYNDDTHWRRGESLQYQGEGPQELQDAIQGCWWFILRQGF